MSKIVSVRKVANGSFQAEMVGRVSKNGRVNVLAELNKGDERFEGTNQRRAWFPITLTSLSELGVNAETLARLEAAALKQPVAISISNPKINGKELVIQVNETIVPDAYQKDHTMASAKQIMIGEQVISNKGINTPFDLSKYKDQKGYFLDADGNFIFSRTTVTIADQLRHTFVDGYLVPEKELSNQGATLAEAMKVKEKAEA